MGGGWCGACLSSPGHDRGAIKKKEVASSWILCFQGSQVCSDGQQSAVRLETDGTFQTHRIARGVSLFNVEVHRKEATLQVQHHEGSYPAGHLGSRCQRRQGIGYYQRRTTTVQILLFQTKCTMGCKAHICTHPVGIPWRPCGACPEEEGGSNCDLYRAVAPSSTTQKKTSAKHCTCS